jgi:hypothetical protein
MKAHHQRRARGVRDYTLAFSRMFTPTASFDSGNSHGDEAGELAGVPMIGTAANAG